MLARHRDPRCKASLETITQALLGTYQSEHLFALIQAVELYDCYQEQVARCDERIQEVLAELQTQAEPPDTPLPKPRHKTPAPNGFGFDVRAALYGVPGMDLTQIHGLAACRT